MGAMLNKFALAPWHGTLVCNLYMAVCPNHCSQHGGYLQRDPYWNLNHTIGTCIVPSKHDPHMTPPSKAHLGSFVQS